MGSNGSFHAKSAKFYTGYTIAKYKLSKFQNILFKCISVLAKNGHLVRYLTILSFVVHILFRSFLENFEYDPSSEVIYIFKIFVKRNFGLNLVAKRNCRFVRVFSNS